MQQTQQLKSQLSTLQLPLSTVIRLILQFLKQQKYHQTFKTLQQQSQIALNIIDKVHIQTIFMQSNWQQLFKQLNYLSLSEDLLFQLYQFVVNDLIDKDRYQSAKFVIKRCIVGGNIIGQNKERLLRLEYICENPTQKAMYHKPPNNFQRQAILNRIFRQTHQQVQKSRLLSLITSALKKQSSKGLIIPNLSYSLLQGKHKNIQNQSQKLISKVDKILRYTSQSRITSLSISNKGQYIALGGMDGLIQLYQPFDYTLDTHNLKFQAEDIMLYHQNSIRHLIFSQTDEMLLSTDQANIIKIWNMQNGRLLRKIQNQGSIGCLSWGLDSSQILIGHQNVHLWGIRGCNLLKQYICGGNQQYLLDLFVNTNNVIGSRLYVFSQIGTIRTYNYKTNEQTNMIHINTPSQNYGQIIKILHKPPASSVTNPLFHIATNRYLITINQSLQQVHRYQINGSGDSIQLINIAITHFYIYQCIRKQRIGTKNTKDKQNDLFVLQVREKKTGRIVHSKDVECQITIMEMHPWRNLLIGYGTNQALTFWRP